MSYLQSLSRTFKFFGVFGITSLLVLTIALGVNFSLFGQSQTIAEAASISNPEAILMLELPDNSNLKTVINQIQSNTKLNQINIYSISSQLDFDGQTQTFVKSNDETKSVKDFVNDFKKSQNAFLKTLVNFKTTNNPEKSVAEPLLKKYSVETLKRTEKKYKSQDAAVKLISIGGNLQDIEKAKSKIKVKNSTLVNLVEQQKQAQALQTKLVGITDEKQKMEIINQEIQKLIPDEVKAQMANQPKLDLTPDQIKQIDTLVKKDLNGNSFVDSNELKQKTNLSLEQVNQVQKAIINFNQSPSDIRDGSNQSTQQVLTTITNKQLEKDENTPVEKLLSFVSEFGNIKTSAQWNPTDGWDAGASSFSVGYWYYGNYMNQRYRFWMNRKVMDSILDGTGNVVNLLAGKFAGEACFWLAWGAAVCAAIAFTISWYLSNWFKESIRSLSWWCSAGTAIDVDLSNNWYLVLYSPYCAYKW